MAKKLVSNYYKKHKKKRPGVHSKNASKVKKVIRKNTGDREKATKLYLVFLY